MNKKQRVLSLSLLRARKERSRDKERYLVLHFQVDVFAFVFFLFFFVRHDDDDDDDAVVVTMFPSFSSRSDDFFFLKTLSVFVCVLSRQVKIKKKEGKKISPIRCPTKKNKKNLSLLPYYSLSLTTQKKLYIKSLCRLPPF